MISVALCTYNGEKYIRQQLDSILAQTMPVDEIVIHDDCSTDSTCEILQEFALSYSQIVVRKNVSNVGFVKNFESVLVECQGDYIFFSDQDDIWVKDKVAVTIDYLKKSGMYGVFSDGQVIDENGNIKKQTLFSVQKLSPYIKSGLLDKYAFEILCLKGNFVTGAALAITKNAKDIVLPFVISKNVIHDMWIALKLSAEHKLGYIEKPLISYRIHIGQERGLDLIDRQDPLLDCFVGSGNHKYLLKCRRFSAVLSYICRFSTQERNRIFNVYYGLFCKCIRKNRSKTYYYFLFILNEIYAFTNSKFGFRI